MSITKLSPNWACQMGPIHCPKFLLPGLGIYRVVQNKPHSDSFLDIIQKKIQCLMPFFLLIYTYTHKQGRNVMFHQRDLSVSASTSAVTSWFRSPYQKWESRALSSLSQVRR